MSEDTTKPVVQKDNKPAKPVKTDKEIASEVQKIHSWKDDPDEILTDFGKVVREMREIDKSTPAGKKRIKELEKLALEDKLYKKAMLLGELDKQAIMSEQVTSRYRPLVTQLARQLIEEYKCTTASEKGLVSMIAGAYGRWLELSSNFQSVAGIEYLSHEKAHWYTMMGKEVDRAFKQYQSGLLTLQTLKNPLAGASIRANNAYIGQNQQFNTAVQQPVTTAEGNPDGTTKQ